MLHQKHGHTCGNKFYNNNNNDNNSISIAVVVDRRKTTRLIKCNTIHLVCSGVEVEKARAIRLFGLCHQRITLLYILLFKKNRNRSTIANSYPKIELILHTIWIVLYFQYVHFWPIIHLTVCVMVSHRSIQIASCLLIYANYFQCRSISALLDTQFLSLLFLLNRPTHGQHGFIMRLFQIFLLGENFKNKKKSR